MQAAMLYVGSALVILWGLAHVVISTKAIVRGFGPLSADNRRILLMAWLMEGVLLVCMGLLVTRVTTLASGEGATLTLVYRVCALVLWVMAGISLGTGARMSIVPMQRCPPIFVCAAVLFWVPTLL